MAFHLIGGCISVTDKVVPVHRLQLVKCFLMKSASKVQCVQSVSMYYSSFNNITEKFRRVWQQFLSLKRVGHGFDVSIRPITNPS